MKQAYPSPITAENFSQAWTYVDILHRTGKKRVFRCRVSAFLSSVLFVLLVLFSLTGIMYQYIGGSFSAFLHTLPLFVPAWEAVFRLLPAFATQWHIQLLLLLAADFLLSFGLCAALVLLAALIYHPRKRPVPDLEDPTHGSQLIERAKAARSCAAKTNYTASGFCCILFMLGIAALLTGYTLSLDDLSDAIVLLSGLPVGSFTLSPVILVMGLFVCIAALVSLFLACIRLLFRFRVSYEIIPDAEYYAHFHQEEDNSREAAAEKRLQAIDYEKAQLFRKATDLFWEAAHLGDPEGMEHYARHCMIALQNEAARYWLQRCVDTGEASPYVVKNLKRLKWGLRGKTYLLHHSAAPSKKKG